MEPDLVHMHNINMKTEFILINILTKREEAYNGAI